MADETENIDIRVQETGTNQVIAILRQLGLTADEATARLTNGLIRASTSQQAATSNAVLLGRAARNGSVDMEALSTALDHLTSAELNASARGNVFATALDRTNRAARDGAAGIATHGQAAAGLGATYSKLGGILQGVAAYLSFKEFSAASDEFTSIRNRISSITDATEEAGTRVSRTGTLIIGLGKSSATAAESLKSLGETGLGIQSIEDRVKGARQALDDFDNGVDRAGRSAADANGANQALAGQLAALGGASASAAGAVTNYWHAVDVATASSNANQSAEQRRASIVNELRSAITEQTAEQDRLAAGSRTLAAATEATRETFNALADASIKNGTSLEQSTELYQRLSANAKDLGLTNKDVITTTRLVGEQLRIFGVGSRQARASMNELAEGFAEGSIKGKQLQAIIREFPQLLQPVADTKAGGSLERLAETFKETGISAQTFVNAYISQGDKIDKASAGVQLSITGAFEALHTQFYRYIGDSNAASIATNLIVRGVQLLGNNLGIIIPVIAAVAAAFSLIKFAELAASVGLFVASFGPLGIAIAATVAVVGSLANSYANYLVASGQAKDTTSAFQQVLSELGAVFAPFKATFDQIVSAFSAFAQRITGTTSGAAAFGEIMKSLGPVVNTLASDISAFVRATLLGLDVIVTSVQNAIVAFQNLGAAITGSQQRYDYKSLPNPQDYGFGVTKPQTTFNDTPKIVFDGQSVLQRDGGVIHARDGIRIPGADKPDTVPVHMLVSKGERIIVQTEDQQAKHDAIMANAKRFAGGGSFVAAANNSTTGYAGFGLASSNVTTNPFSGAVDITPTGSDAGTTLSGGSDSGASNNQGTPKWVTRNDYGTQPYADDQKAYKSGLFPYPGLDSGERQPYHFYADGQGPLVKNADGQGIDARQANANNTVIQFIGGVPASPVPDAALQYFKSHNGGVGPVPPTVNGRSPGHFGSAYRDGGVIHARDGIDFDVPGAGAVDSRLVNLAVSPGERVAVQTADDAAKGRQRQPVGSGRPVVNVTVKANDPGSLQRSKRQLTDTLVKSLRKSGV